jgi:hypothetical protein
MWTEWTILNLHDMKFSDKFLLKRKWTFRLHNSPGITDHLTPSFTKKKVIFREISWLVNLLKPSGYFT